VRGLWWKSLLAAWIALQAVGYGFLLLDIEVPEAAGPIALGVGWLATWAGWRAWSRRWGVERSAVLDDPVLGGFRRLFVASLVAVGALGGVAVAIDQERSAGTGRDGSGMSGSSTLLLALAVAVLAAICLVGRQWWVGAVDRTDVTTSITTFRSRFFAQLAWSIVPALAAFAGVLASGRWWLYVVGGVPAAVGVGLTGYAVRRDNGLTQRSV